MIGFQDKYIPLMLQNPALGSRPVPSEGETSERQWSRERHLGSGTG